MSNSRQWSKDVIAQKCRGTQSSYYNCASPPLTKRGYLKVFAKKWKLLASSNKKYIFLKCSTDLNFSFILLPISLVQLNYYVLVYCFNFKNSMIETIFCLMNVSSDTLCYYNIRLSCHVVVNPRLYYMLVFLFQI